MGLIVFIVNGKVKLYKIELEIRELEKILRLICEISCDEDVEKYVVKFEEEVLIFLNWDIDDDINILIIILIDVLRLGIDFFGDCRVFSRDELEKNVYWYAKFVFREC